MMNDPINKPIITKRDPGNDNQNVNIFLWFTIPIFILLAIASFGGVFIEGLYRDVPYFVAQARGQDLVSLVIVLPTLFITAMLAKRGSPRGQMIWIGTMVYLVYTYTIAAFVVKFNPLTLVYIALLGLSLYALIIGLVTINKSWIKEHKTKKNPAKLVSIYMILLAILFYSLWLGDIVPALIAGKTPQSVLANGTPTNPIHVLDMAWILPAFGITGISLWHHRSLGYTLAGIMLSYVSLLLSAILSMLIFMIQSGFLVMPQQAVIFVVLFIVNLGLLISYIRSFR